YFNMLRGSWGQKLCEVFDSIEDPMWHGEKTEIPLVVQPGRYQALKKISTPQEKLI
ncbi:MAG: putative proteasome-type protease, partial [Rhodoferax sp.]